MSAHNLTEQDIKDIHRVIAWLHDGDTPPAAEIKRIVERNADLRGCIDTAIRERDEARRLLDDARAQSEAESIAFSAMRAEKERLQGIIDDARAQKFPDSHLVRIDGICKTVRIEWGKAGKEMLSPLVTFDGTLSDMFRAIEQAKESVVGAIETNLANAAILSARHAAAPVPAQPAAVPSEVARAVQILRKHNEWRRGADNNHWQATPYSPAELGRAIDTVCDATHDIQHDVLNRATEYAHNIVTWLHRDHYADNTTFEPFGDLLGLLSQIDNMICGWKEPQPSAVPEAAAKDAIPPGWVFFSADASIQANDKRRPMTAMIRRDVDGLRWWLSLTDEEKERTPLHSTGAGMTLTLAIQNAVDALLSAADTEVKNG